MYVMTDPDHRSQATAASFLAAEHLGADAAKIGLWFFAFPVGFMAGSFISGRIGANRSIEFMTILGGVVGVANAGCSPAGSILAASRWPRSSSRESSSA